MEKKTELKQENKIAMNHNETILALVVDKKIAMNHNETILQLKK